MPVSGLVVTLSADQSRRDAALSALRNNPSIQIGEMAQQRLPLTTDTPSSDVDQALWDWLHQLPGVLFVDLVCTDSTEDAPVCAEKKHTDSRQPKEEFDHDRDETGST